MELLATVVSFTLVLTIANRKKDLGMALVVGAISMTVLSGLNYIEIWEIVLLTLSDSMTWELVGIIVLIGVLGKTMQDMGHLEGIVSSLIKLSNDSRWSLILIPGVMGLLPVPGGAAMSAPLMDRAGDTADLGRNDKAAMNLFYRHIWYLVFPLYPSLILAESISGISVWHFIKLQVPAAIIGFVAAYYQFFPKSDRSKYKIVKEVHPGAAKELGWSILPLGVVLIMALPLGIHFIVALTVGIILTIVTDRREIEQSVLMKVEKSVLPGINGRLAFTIVSVMLFQYTVREVGSVQAIAEMMTQVGVPLFPLVLAVSFITGFSTGSNIAAVGATFAVFMPMLPEQFTVQYLSLIYVIGLVGYMISPLHLCLVVTNDYFASEPIKLLHKTAKPIAALVIWSIIFMWVIINL